MKTEQIVPRKHINKKVDERQDKVISAIKQSKGYKTYLEAKHEYFENQADYDKYTKEVDDFKAQESPKEAQEEPQKKKRGLSIRETKLGITMVLSHADCEKLGFSLDLMAKEGVRQVREKLGLDTKRK